MLKVAIADDEPMICVVIQKCIHWEELGLEQVGVASDGYELLELVHKESPDIVITDINMPGLNGLELIEACRKEKSRARFVIITGYKQFDYVHKALKNNVDDYLLKPVKEDELNATLRTLRNNILAEQADGKETIRSLQEDLYKNQEQLKEMFLSRLLSDGKNVFADRELLKDKYGLEFTEDGRYRALIAKVDISGSEDLEEGFSSVRNKLVSAAKLVFEEASRELFIYESPGKMLVGVYYAPTDSPAFLDRCHRLYEKCRTTVELFGGLNFTLCASSEHSRAEELVDAFDEAETTMYYRLREGINRLLVFDSLKMHSDQISDEGRIAKISEIQHAMDVLDADSFSEAVEGMFFDIGVIYNPRELVQLCEDIGGRWIRTLRKMNPDRQSDFDTDQDLFKLRINNAVNRQDLKNVLLGQIVQEMNAESEEKKKQKKKPVRQAIQYIEEHFRENLTLEIVADQVGLNPVYLSNIFKKEVGDNFTDYVQKCRIASAREKLRNTDETILQIAIEVGYSDSKYFSKTFKKYEGIKPTDYRKIYG